MKSVRLWVWLAPLLCYGLFWFWYTPLSGPMTPEEVEQAIAELTQDRADPEAVARMRSFFEEDDGQPFIMVNVMDTADNPEVLPGTGPDADADDLLAHYMEYMWPALFSRACHPVFSGAAVNDSLDLVGIDGAETWDSAALMRYRSRRDMWKIAADPRFADRHEYKVEAMEKTIAYPVQPQLMFSDPRFILLLLILSVLGVVDALVWRRKT
ncbi:MAG: hypothetical protein AAFR64_02270 [Pseudomonadota bacterium]